MSLFMHFHAAVEYLFFMYLYIHICMCVYIYTCMSDLFMASIWSYGGLNQL